MSGSSAATPPTAPSTRADPAAVPPWIASVLDRGAPLDEPALDSARRLAPWAHAFVGLFSVLPRPGGTVSMLEAFERAAGSLLGTEECSRHVQLTAAAHDGMVAAAVSRLVTVLDPLMRAELARRDATCAPESWLDAPALTRSEEEWRALLERYPVASYVAGVALSQWRDSVVEMLERLARDLSALADSILVGVELGALDHVEMGAGDLHEGGRSVALLRFSSGVGLVYKPRELGTTELAQRVLELVNSTGLAPRLATRRVLALPGYGYEERLEPAPVGDAAGADAFYARLGALARVLQLLGARDMWADNLLAVADDPHFVDFECLLCPAFDPPVLLSDARQRLYARRESSVLSTAILLAARPPGAIVPSRDLGCLSHLDDPVDQGGGGIRIGPFRPYLGDTSFDPWQFATAIERGYRAADDALASVRDQLSSPHGALSEVATLRSRFIWRDTFTYVEALHDSVQPEALEAPSARESVLAARGAATIERADGVDSRLDVATLSALEVAALRRLDVPMFHTIVGETAIVGADGVRMEAQFEHSAQAALQRRVRGIGKDAEADVAIVRAAIDAARGGRAEVVGPSRRPAVRDLSELAASAALEISGLLATARLAPLGSGDGWLSVSTEPVSGLVDVVGAGADLAGGALGPALFLAELDAIVGSPSAGALAGDVIRELLGDSGWTWGVGDPGLLGGPLEASGVVGPCALVATGSRVAAAIGDASLHDELGSLRWITFAQAQAALEDRDVASLAPLYHHLLSWAAPPGHEAAWASVLASAAPLLEGSLAGRPRARSVPGLSRYVPAGDDAVATALAATWQHAPFLLSDPDAVAAALRARTGASTRGARLAALRAAAAGIGDPTMEAPPPVAPELDVGALALAADEWQLRANVLGEPRGATMSAMAVNELLGRRAETGRFLAGRVGGDEVCLSSFDGLCAVGRVLLRFLEPSLPPAGMPW